MNKIKGVTVQVESSSNISLVTIEANGKDFSSLIIDTPANAPYLEPGKEVHVLFKETEVSIAKGRTGLISMNNVLEVVITKISKGNVLARLELDFSGIPIVSVITTRSANRLGLSEGDKVEALVKSNEITLMEV
jgi:molybdopterin-binding protein